MLIAKIEGKKNIVAHNSVLAKRQTSQGLGLQKLGHFTRPFLVRENWSIEPNSAKVRNFSQQEHSPDVLLFLSFVRKCSWELPGGQCGVCGGGGVPTTMTMTTMPT